MNLRKPLPFQDKFSAGGEVHREVLLAPVELDFQFEYNTRVYTPLAVIANYRGPVPCSQEIIIFGGSESAALRQAGLPSEVWKVQQLVFEFLNRGTKRIALTLVPVSVEAAPSQSFKH